MTIAEKVKSFFFETNRLFFVRSWPKLLSCFFFCLVQSSNLISRNFYYDTMQQYRYSNFSDVFCLNCNFVIDAAVKQLASGSSLKYEVSAVTMAAHKIFLKSNLHCNRFIKLAVVLQRRSEWWRPTPRLNAWTTQLRRNVAAVASRWLLLTGLGIEPQTFHVIATTLTLRYNRPQGRPGGRRHAWPNRHARPPN